MVDRENAFLREMVLNDHEQLKSAMLTAVLKECVNLRVHKAARDGRIEHLESEVVKKDAEIASLRDVGAYAYQYGKEANAFEEQLREAQTTIATLDEEVARLRSVNDSLCDVIRNRYGAKAVHDVLSGPYSPPLAADPDHLNTRVRVLREERDRLAAKNGEWKQQLRARDQAIGRLASQRDKLKEDYDRRYNELQGLCRAVEQVYNVKVEIKGTEIIFHHPPRQPEWASYLGAAPGIPGVPGPPMPGGPAPMPPAPDTADMRVRYDVPHQRV